MAGVVERVVGGRYHLDREIGRGGMGAVWLAHDEVLRRPVAVKRVALGSGLDETTVSRAHREARLAATLSHPHVVAVLDLVREEDHVWLVMEYVDSLNLTQFVRREGPLSPDRAAALLAQAAEALAAAHRAGIVHRDVKPSNMLVLPDERLKLSDFGIARAHGDDTLTSTGLVVGSPAYLAPEVARGQHATEASDVWSLGVTAYFALTGRTAYETEGGHVMATLHKIVTEEPPRPPVPGRLAPLFDGTLVLEPDQRWTMAEVAAFLSRPAGPGSRVPLASVPPATGPVVPRADRRLPAESSEPTQAFRPVVVPDAQPRPVVVPETQPPGPHRPRTWAWVLAAVLVLALVAGGGWLLLGRGDRGGSSSAGSPGGSSGQTTGGSSGGSSGGVTGGAASGQPTAAGMEAFVRGYLQTVTRDPAAGWALLTPAFQRASRPYAGYVRAWEARPFAQVSRLSADPASLQVSYDVRYRDRRGRPLPAFSGPVTLILAYADGRYLIAAER